MLHMMNSLFDLEITGAEEGRRGRCTFNRITGCHSQTQPEQHTVFLCANKWGLAAAWPRSFSLMSWRNRQSLWGYNMQKDSSITTPQLCLHTCLWWILPDWVEEKVTICAIRSADYGWSLIGCLASKTLNQRFPGHCSLLKGNHITTDGGVLISQSARSYCSSLSLRVFELWPPLTNFWTQVQRSIKNVSESRN